MTRSWRILFALILTGLVGCHLTTQPSGTPVPKIPAEQASAITQTLAAVLTTNTITPPTEINKSNTQSSPFPVPQQLTFPTSAPQPLPTWRPPLYPTPWVPTEHDHFYFSRPIAANVLTWILANYRYGGVFFRGEVHTGVDIPVKVGTPVLAAGSGRVTWAGYGLYRGEYDPTDPYGMAVVIRHDFGYEGQTLFTVYGHMSRIDVERGQIVDTGQIIGLSGATGNVTGPHLHFEVRIGHNSFSRSRNPELWLSPPQGWGILAGRVLNKLHAPVHSEEVIIISKDTSQKLSVKTYGGEGAANSDPYYQENVVLGDLPAGKYQVWIPTLKSDFFDITIYPGRVSYFTFIEGTGYNDDPPPGSHNHFKPPTEPTASAP